MRAADLVDIRREAISGATAAGLGSAAAAEGAKAAGTGAGLAAGAGAGAGTAAGLTAGGLTAAEMAALGLTGAEIAAATGGGAGTAAAAGGFGSTLAGIGTSLASNPSTYLGAIGLGANLMGDNAGQPSSFPGLPQTASAKPSAGALRASMANAQTRGLYPGAVSDETLMALTGADPSIYDGVLGKGA